MAPSAPVPRCSNTSAIDLMSLSGGLLIPYCLECPDSTPTNCWSDVDYGAYKYVGSCEDLTSSDDNCGTCGNNCVDNQFRNAADVKGGKTCVDGTCACTSGDGFVGNDRQGYCDAETSKIVVCPLGTANCDRSFTFGSASDCAYNITSDASNCGACDVECGDEETCTDGKCVCGTTGSRCTDPLAPICSDGKCVGCTTPGSGDECVGSYPEAFRLFCTAANTCEVCPAGTADCDASGDTGVTGDCETNVAVTGITDSCGACGVSVGNPGTPQLTCCAGRVGCGTFANNSAPTAEECAAAEFCDENSYCDGNLKKCVVLSNPFKYKNCDGTETSPGGGHSVNSYPYCGSCDMNTSIANIKAGADPSLPMSQWCNLFDGNRCGSTQGNASCDFESICIQGKCAVDRTTYYLSGDVFDSIEPGAGIPDGIPAPGCSVDEVLGMLNGWTNHRIGRYVSAFLGCVQARDQGSKNFSIIVADDFNVKARRDLICRGQPGECEPAFCDELQANTTAAKPQFCAELGRTVKELIRCNTEAVPRINPTGYEPESPFDASFSRNSVKEYTTPLITDCLTGDNAIIINSAVWAGCDLLGEDVVNATFYLGSNIETLGLNNKAGKGCLAAYSAGEIAGVSVTVVAGVVMMMMSAMMMA